MLICLRVSSRREPDQPPGPTYGYRFDQHEVLIGRGEHTEVRLPDPAVSLVHARLLVKNDVVVAMDMMSTNGTFVDSGRLAFKEQRAIGIGSCLRIGPFELLLVDPDEAYDVPETTGESTAALARRMVMEALGQLGGDEQRLVVLSGPRRGEHLPLSGMRCVIGRGADCDIVLPDADASRAHFEILRQGASLFARDLGSKNTLLIDGKPASGEQLLRHRQELTVGRTRLRFEDLAEGALEALKGPEVGLNLFAGVEVDVPEGGALAKEAVSAATPSTAAARPEFAPLSADPLSADPPSADPLSADPLSADPPSEGAQVGVAGGAATGAVDSPLLSRRPPAEAATRPNNAPGKSLQGAFEGSSRELWIGIAVGGTLIAAALCAVLYLLLS